METIAPFASIDGGGKTITTFVVYQATERMAEMTEGDVLELLTDAVEPFEADIEAWCGTTGHRLLASEQTVAELRFLIEKGPEQANDSRLAMVISADGLDGLLSPLGFALAAALEGIDVRVYFQGPAVRVLTRGFHPKLHGWARPFSRFAAAGMNKAGHIPAQEKLEQIRSLGGRLYVCGGSLQPFKVRRQDLIFDDLPIVEYFTFMAIMEQAEIQIYV